MNRREVLFGGAAALTLMAGARAASAADEVVIGAIYPMSGANAQIGVDARHALETAAEIVNGVHDLDLPTARTAGLPKLGGAKIRLIFADHQGDPQKGRAEAERLITQEKVTAIVGAFHSSVSATVSATCERYALPYVAADSSSPSLHRRGLKFFFRPAAHDEMFSAAMFDFLDEQKKAGKKIETVALFFEDTIFGTDSSNVQRKLAGERGYKVVADVKYRANSPSLTSEVQQLKSADADVVMPSSYTTDALLLVKTMGELGYKPKNMMAQAAGFSEKAVFDAVGDRLEGLVSRASFALDLAAKRKSIAVVNDMFKARAARDLNDNTSRQFNALLVLADAIDRAGSLDGAKIRDALAATDIPGEQTIMPWRAIRFGADGQNELCDPVLIQYLGGKFVTVYPTGVALQAAKWPMNG
ncbi:amino acid ABC transporter substrate-binding protein [Siculibacillus lacustris]|uniref:Amino acid ABC transporter substrate-binding protein n=1 Tax=Siculibacillus lacustris TaxID=1549641 RepID=A0A4V2KU74_9HYPH|nr:ABC transporter substrate-binding protein [Siculibacillus lacustris]TBW40275.1 amino acid ABC transporter substrate-binding protein [Siculibacillus lacustris]